MSMTVIATFNLNLSIDSTDSIYSALSLANLEALAQNNNGGEKEEGIEVLNCMNITITDPETGERVTVKQKNCSGTGKHSCSCP